MKLKRRLALAWKIIRASDKTHGGMLGHANAELALALPSGDEMDMSFRQSVEEVIFVFSLEGHSGFSAAYAIGALEKLLRFEPLTALTGADDEWCDMSEYSSEPMWQNRRNSRVFKGTDGQAYIIDHFIFVEPDGSTYTRGDRHPIQFPYEGEEPEMVHVDAHGMPADPKYYALCGVVPPVPKIVEKFPVKVERLKGSIHFRVDNLHLVVKDPAQPAEYDKAISSLVDMVTDNLPHRAVVALHAALAAPFRP